MLIFQSILAAAAVTALVVRGSGPFALAVALAAAAIDVALGASPLPALRVVAPVVVFLGAAFTLAGIAERSGLAERVAERLARTARGDSRALYVLVCCSCALLTAAVSLDAAVVLMIPLLRQLRRLGAPFGPLFLGVIAVANSASIAVAQGNPTNLVVIGALGIDPAAFSRSMLVPGIAAVLVCAGGVAFHARRELDAGYRAPGERPPPPLVAAERRAAAGLAAAALAAWLAPFLGAAPWWPFALAVAGALLLARGGPDTPVLPWRLGLQLAAMLIAIGSLDLAPAGPRSPGLAGLLAVAACVGIAAALANNLPVSLSLVALFQAGPAALAASIGLAVGSLATPSGSVATLVAADLAGEGAPTIRVRLFAPLAAVATMAATVALWVDI